MKVSELLTDLINRSQLAQVLMVEKDVVVNPGNVFMIDSVVKERDDKVVILMGKRITPTPLEEFFSGLVEDRERGKPTKVFKTAIHKSEKSDGYQVSIDGRILQTGFGAVEEAKLFVRGFVLGFEMGKSEKGLNAADLPGL